MARKAVLVALECPNCGAKGAAEYEENGMPLRDTQALDRELRGVTGPFWVGAGRNPAIYCAHCNVMVA
jgi:hypothetical protein